MTGTIIEQLDKIDSSVAQKILGIIQNTLEPVEDSFYESTVFGSKSEYSSKKKILNQAFLQNFGKQLVETPLTFLRGEMDAVQNAKEGTGIATGTILIDYRTKKILMLAVIDKTQTSYQYYSLKYNQKDDSYDKLTMKTKNAKSLKELLDFVSENVGKDIASFVEA